MAKCFGWKCILIFFIINLVTADRIRDMIYMSFDGVAACFRRHNGTHQFGCSSSKSGSTGVIHLIEEEEDIKWIEVNGTAGPYTAIVPFSLFTRDTLIRLRNTNNINGVLLTKNNTETRPYNYSPEDSCPNRYAGYEQCNNNSPWNPSGSALLLEDWPFPMFYTDNETLIEAVNLCFHKHNAHDMETQRARPLCALEMKSFMFAAVNSESCIRRSDFTTNIHPTLFCDPLGDRNIHWPLTPLKEGNNSVILVTARLDASSLFDGISPGAQNTVTGLVTLLATATYLNTLVKNTLGTLEPVVNDTNIVFSLLNGEAFDYIGSSRFVYDLTEGNFNALGGVNLKLDEIRYMIELGQLGRGNLYLHTKNGENSEIVRRLSEQLNAKVLKNSVPPTSAQSFLRNKPDFSTIVIANHGKQFVNRYYNGILDDAESVGFVPEDWNQRNLTATLVKIARQLAEILYETVTERVPEPIHATDHEDLLSLVSNLLSCYLESANCSLFSAASVPGAKISNQVLPLYVGVHRVPNTATSFTGQLLALLTGELLDVSEATCHEKRFAWMAGRNSTGVCVNSNVNYSTALSPAFIIKGYDMKSGVYSTWTESIWQGLSVRMFLKPSAATERLSMILGSVVCSLSFVLVWFVNSRADTLFNSRGPTDC